jgi:hypothetical protein
VNADLINLLQSTRLAEHDIFDSLDPAVRDAPMRVGGWSPKDHQAHLTAWKARQADRFAAARQGVELPAVTEGEETDEINAELQAERADRAWEAIAAEAAEVSAQLEREIAATDPELLASSDRLLAGTLGNGPFHAMTHFGWLIDASVGVDRIRVGQFVDDVVEHLRASELPSAIVSEGLYNAACFRALQGELDMARTLLRESFELDRELIPWSKQDEDLVALRDELDELAATASDRTAPERGNSRRRP